MTGDSILPLIDDARAAGLRFRLSGDGLKIRGPHDAEPFARRILSRKSEAVAYFREYCSQCDNPLQTEPSRRLGVCLRCMTDEEYTAAVKDMGQRHRLEREGVAA